jgi:hypothetical protein
VAHFLSTETRCSFVARRPSKYPSITETRPGRRARGRCAPRASSIELDNNNRAGSKSSANVATRENPRF